MKDDSQAAGQRRHPFRYLLFSLAALLVLSLGITLIPAEPPAPGPPSAAERARSAALDDALRLRTAAGPPVAGPGGKPAPDARVSDVVTLLTLQARALLLPEEAAPRPDATAGASGAGTPEAAVYETLSVPDLARNLAASGTRRLQDATTTDDGGLARLLAGIGAAQLLAAERLVAGTAAAQLQAGTAAASSPSGSRPASPTAAPCPSPTAAPAASAPTGPAASASPGAAQTPDAAAALSAVLLAEREAVYAYEAAMPRLGPGAAGPASAFLGSHRNLARDAENRLRLDCRAAPVQQPGYAIDADFLQSPAGRLGRLEAGTLGAYGDLIALSEGGTREWAVSSLPAAAARALQWGADPGPVPGLAIDPARLPEQPVPATQGPQP